MELMPIWGKGRRKKAGEVERLAQSLEDSEARTRWEAAEALGRVASAKAGPALVKALGDEHPFVRWKAGEALVNLGAKRALDEQDLPFLEKLLNDEGETFHKPVREVAQRSIDYIKRRHRARLGRGVHRKSVSETRID